LPDFAAPDWNLLKNLPPLAGMKSRDTEHLLPSVSRHPISLEQFSCQKYKILNKNNKTRNNGNVMLCYVVLCYVKIADTLLGALQTFFEFFTGFSTNFSVLFHKSEKNDVEFQR